jgi:hypothetical protein
VEQEFVPERDMRSTGISSRAGYLFNSLNFLRRTEAFSATFYAILSDRSSEVFTSWHGQPHFHATLRPSIYPVLDVPGPNSLTT